MKVTCPKCRYEQPASEECHRCGLIFSRYRPMYDRPGSAFSGAVEGTVPRRGLRPLRIIRWAILASAVTALGLALHKTEPPAVEVDAEAQRHVEAKMAKTERALRAGRPASLMLSEAEVNHWLSRNLQIGDPPPAQVVEMIGRDATTEEIRHAVEELRMKLVGDEVQAYLVFDFHGKSMSLSVNGRVRTSDGYLRFVPTSGWLGSLPIPLAALRRAVEGAFSSPENREKLRLPDYVSDLAVENSQIVVSYRR